MTPTEAACLWGAEGQQQAPETQEGGEMGAPDLRERGAEEERRDRIEEGNRRHQKKEVSYNSSQETG